MKKEKKSLWLGESHSHNICVSICINRGIPGGVYRSSRMHDMVNRSGGVIRLSHSSIPAVRKQSIADASGHRQSCVTFTVCIESAWIIGYWPSGKVATADPQYSTFNNKHFRDRPTWDIGYCTCQFDLIAARFSLYLSISLSLSLSLSFIIICFRTEEGCSLS